MEIINQYLLHVPLPPSTPSWPDCDCRCGFASTQKAYDAAVTTLFRALDRADAMLDKSRYLCGNLLTEADIRLAVTLFRFDEVRFNA